MDASTEFASEEYALNRDRNLDPPLARDQYLLPTDSLGTPIAYLAGNSLGLQPKSTRAALDQELDSWATLAVRGHSHGAHPWMAFPSLLAESSAAIVGAEPHEIVMMNSLTINLHMLLASFYQPRDQRRKIVMEDYAFSSDAYAIRSHVAFRGRDPDKDVIRLKPREGEDSLRTEDVVAVLRERGEEISTILFGAVNYYSGEFMDIPTITAAAHDVGAYAGWDLAHAAGNIPMNVHDWGVDFAAWCSYKYLNAGPGSVAGAFIHVKHHTSALPRLEGWWTNKPETRFVMNPVVDPLETAEAWAVSNPPVLIMSPALSALEVFSDVGMPSIRARSLQLTQYMRQLVAALDAQNRVHVITPSDPDRHGAQLSIRVPIEPFALIERMYQNHGVLGDARNPDIIRLAPIPMYNTFHDVWRAITALFLELDAQ
ncbi:MAG: kynureninase [Candidatus Nanopelagicales bacterium]|nr:kynureninase [Candidatus Nanopelagicales bacterium]